jgi:hypothetical protein
MKQLLEGDRKQAPRFEGTWKGTVQVNSTAKGVNSVENQIVILRIKKIYETGYLCVFEQVYPPVKGSLVTDLEENTNTFTCVVNKTTESDLLLQGGGLGGLNSIYFNSNDLATLNTTFSTSFDDGTFLSGTQSYTRVV